MPIQFPNIIKIPRRNKGSMLFDMSLSNVFLDMTPQAMWTKAKIKKWDYTKLKSSAHGKGNHQQNEKTTYQAGEDICKSCI